MVIQKKVFTKGIDSDTADEYIGEGVDRYRLNVRVLSSENGNLGAIETMNGNTAVSFSLPVGTNKVIGAKEFPLTRKIYYFVYNSNSSHSIVEYDYVNNSTSFVLTHESLNFKEDYLITSINFVKLNDDAHLLHWTDGYINPNDESDYNEPKKINIEKGKLYMQGYYVNGYSSPFDGEFIFAIKQPPLCAPEYRWSGLDNSTPEFTASFEDDRQFNSIDPASNVVFQNVLLNNNNVYDNSTGRFTAPTSGNYNITATFGFNIFDNDGTKHYWTSYIRMYVNGILDYEVYDRGYAPQNPTTSLRKNLYLNQNDVVAIKLEPDNYPLDIVNYGRFSATQLVSVTNNINYLFKKLYKFKSKFIYDDYEESAWSPESDYEFPETVKDSVTQQDIVLQDNTITIDIPTGNSIVKKIKLAAKEITQGDWYEVVELDKSELQINDNTVYPFEFTNDVVGIPLLENESIKLFDNLPLVADAADIIKGERVVYGGVVEGFNPVDIDLKLLLSFETVTTNTNTFYPAVSVLKSGGLYEYGLVYYDHANRSGLTNIKKGKSTVLLPDGTYGTTMYIPFLTEDDYNRGIDDITKVPVINAEIYNVPPDWATHYQIVRSKNKKFENYLQFVSTAVTWVDENGATVSVANATRVKIDISNIIGVYKTENDLSNLVYDWAKGDRIRFIANYSTTGATGISFNSLSVWAEFNDTEIDSFDSGTQTVTIKLSTANDSLRTAYYDATQTGIRVGSLFEIYTPKPIVNEEAEVMYEIGECYDVLTLVNGDKIHSGLAANQAYFTFTDNYYLAGNKVGFIGIGTSGFVVGDKIKIAQNAGFIHAEYNTYATVTKITPSGANEIVETNIDWQGTTVANGGVITKAARVKLSGGDTFKRYQNLPFINAGSTTRLYTYIESMNVSDMFVSNAADYGRPNRIDNDYKRVKRPSTIYYSEKFIPETFINGLNSFYDVNFESYNQNYGGIKRLKSEDDVLLMFQEYKIGQVPIERIIYNDLQNNQAVGASSTVLSAQVVYYAGEFGLTHPESLGFYGKVKYGIDANRGVSWRLSNDGLTPISDIYGQHNYFTDKLKDILSSANRVKVLGLYDVKFNEYVVCFAPYVSGVYGAVAGETIAFNEIANQFSTHYSYVPEMGCGVNVDIITFLDGVLYKHNTNSLQANFYGVQYYPEIHSVCNINPYLVKVLSSVSEETNDAWACYEISTPNIQRTNLIESDFTESENNQYASLWRDENTPNVVDPLINGDEMRDRTFLLKFKYNNVGYNKLFSLNYGVIESSP